MGWGSLGSITSWVKGLTLVLFLFYMNISRLRPRSCLSFHRSTIPTPLVPFRVGWSIPLVPPWVTASRFLAGNREAELKLTAFSSLLRFRVFLCFLFP